ncbi:hypothetical protein HYW32_00615 [Candidatus Berkelbacteria bacterium]|nr:hypothetical protein [Candidatus Berkelbacteria bacterium]
MSQLIWWRQKHAFYDTGTGRWLLPPKLTFFYIVFRRQGQEATCSKIPDLPVFDLDLPSILNATKLNTKIGVWA